MGSNSIKDTGYMRESYDQIPKGIEFPTARSANLRYDWRLVNPIMVRPVICPELCGSCQPCEARLVCNTRAIMRIDPDEPSYIAIERCSRCGACIPACTLNAIVMLKDGVAIGTRCRGSDAISS